MGILKYIFKAIFGKSDKQKRFESGGTVATPTMEVVHRRFQEEISAKNPNLEKSKKKKNVVGQKTLLEIKDYLLNNGSIDVLTCEQKFNVKSLRNFIWYLRKDGLKIKTEKVGLHNELGNEVEVTNYRLISKK